MGTSSKRYGLEVSGDLELELRLRRIESRLEQLVGASDFGGSDDVQRVSSIPTVTGLRVKGRTPGATTVAWNQLRLSDLRRYELQIAENLAFTQNLQSFNVAGTEFQFSTLTTTGGGGGTTIYARVRARTNNGNTGSYSAVLNTSTGQAQTSDIADQSVTDDKVAVGGNIPPQPALANAGQHVRVDSTGANLEYGYKLPTTPTANAPLVGDGTDVVQTSYTIPTSISNNQLLVGNAGNVGQTTWTVPTSISNNQLLIGSGGNIIQTTFTFPTTIASGKLLRASSTNVIAETSYQVPSSATLDSVMVGDGTDFVLHDQNPSDSAPGSSGNNGTGSNRQGSVTLAGGLKLDWNTVALVNATPTNQSVTGGTVRTVMACTAEEPGATQPEVNVWAYVSGATQITIEQNNTNADTLDVTYWVISEV